MKMNINFQVTGNDRKKGRYINNTWYYFFLNSKNIKSH